MERGPIIEALLRQLLEILDMAGSHIRPELENHIALGSGNDCDFVGGGVAHGFVFGFGFVFSLRRNSAEGSDGREGEDEFFHKRGRLVATRKAGGQLPLSFLFLSHLIFLSDFIVILDDARGRGTGQKGGWLRSADFTRLRTDASRLSV
jgi:hypothetical protein